MFHCLIANLGKLLFPRSEHWRQRKKARVFLVVLTVQLVIGLLIALLGLAMTGQ